MQCVKTGEPTMSAMLRENYERSRRIVPAELTFIEIN
jgi:hypothetical protein